jgi:bla regulator protein BlaR1
MMPDSVARMILTVSDSLELSIVAKATIVLGLALVAARLARRARASVRHVMLAAAFGVLLTLPAVATLLPPVAVSIPIMDTRDSIAASPVVEESAAARRFPQAPLAMDSTTTQWWSGRIPTLLHDGWITVAMFFLVPIGAMLWRVQRLRRSSVPWPKGKLLLQTMAQQAGIRRPVDILLHRDIPSPLTCGFVQPAIVLPTDAEAWSDVDVRRAIVHELEHVRRADWPAQLVARAVCAVYWFHPLVWIAWRQLCLESERACDDAVLQGTERTEYAEQLVTLASRLSTSAMRPMLSMASRSDLSTRVTAVLDSHQARGRAGVLGASVTIATAGLTVFAISPLRAVTVHQLPALDGGPTFDVASVKPNNSGDLRVSLQVLPGGRYTATNAPVRTLIRDAYALQGFQLAGGPAWLDSGRFDVVAKVEGNPAPNQVRLMLRALLAERFRLRVHSETRDLALYALMMSRTDGKPGPQLRQTGADCAQVAPWLGTAPPAVRDPNPPCGFAGPGIEGVMRFRGITMEAFAKFLATPVRRPVIDRTGLTGDFDADLELTAELGPPPPPPGAPDKFDRTSVPSIFTALQEQLGLKLYARRGPVEVIVIDRVELPVPN